MVGVTQGTPVARREISDKHAARFWERVQVSDGCWLWQGGLNIFGYGVAWIGRTRAAHRVAYTLAKGDIPKGLHVLHSCDNPPCCNPRHLSLGTPAENSAQREARGRGNHPRGEGAGPTKLTLEAVREIRAGYPTWRPDKLPFRLRMAEKHGVTERAVRAVIHGEAWGWVESE